MVQDFYDQVLKESVRFSDRVNALRAGDAPDEEATWFSVINDLRTEKLVDGEDDVKITMGGEGTSEVYIIDDNGSKTYFKESEKVPSYSYRVHLQAETDLLQKKMADASTTDEEKETARRRHGILVEIGKAMKAHSSESSVGDILSADEVKTPEMLYGIVKGMFKSKVLAGKPHPMQALEEEYKKLKAAAKEKKDALAAAKNANESEETIARLEAEYANAVKIGDNCDYVYIALALNRIRKNLKANYIALHGAKIENDSEISKRNVATSRLAQYFGLDDLIAESVMTEITIGDKKMRGIRMKEAEGTGLAKNVHVAYKETSKKTGQRPDIRYSGNAVKQLMTLQVFDLLCGQVDRNDGNYLSVMEEDPEHEGHYLVKKVTGIDNDMSFGKLKYSEIYGTGSNGYMCMKNIEQKGKFTLPALDREFANKILDTEPAVLDYMFADLLSKEEREALVDRLNNIKRVIRKQMDREAKAAQKGHPIPSVFLTNDEQWEAKAIEFHNKYTGMQKGDQKQVTKDDEELRKFSYLRGNAI